MEKSKEEFDPERYYKFVTAEEKKVMYQAIHNVLNYANAPKKTLPGCCEEEWVEQQMDENMPKDFDYRTAAFNGIEIVRKIGLEDEGEQIRLVTYLLAAERGVKIA